MRRALRLVVIIGLLVIGTGARTTVSAAVLHETPSAAGLLPRITVTQQHFVNTATGQVFVPRGANYVRLAQTSAGTWYHSTFEPGQYNQAAIRAALDQMSAAGYNVVRVFIDPGSFQVGPPHGIGRGIATFEPYYAPYLDNVASFVLEAARRGLYVVPVLDVFPQNCYYYRGWTGRQACSNQPAPHITGSNMLYLDHTYVAAKVLYLTEFARSLLRRVGRSNAAAILAYQSDNEVFFEASQGPFSAASGTFTATDGRTYQLADAAARQAIADVGLSEYARAVRAGLRAGDPTGRLTMGFFTNQAVGRLGFNGLLPACRTECSAAEYRVPGRPVAVGHQVDFLDLHAYPGLTNPGRYSLATDLQSLEAGKLQRPWIMGEFGAFKSAYGGSLAAAAAAMQAVQRDSCDLGAQGWLFWTWDTTEEATQRLFFTLTQDGGAVSTQLAPKTHPQVCA